MNIVVLDTIPSNPGDLSWAPLQALGRVQSYEITPPESLRMRAAEADVLITNKCKLTGDLLRSLPRLKLICVTATGYDNIDGKAARALGITLCNVPAYSTASTAQTTIALLLELTQHCGQHSAAVHAGKWAQSPVFSFWETPLVELAGKSMLLLGSGHIGIAVGRIATALGMEVSSAVIPGRPVDTPSPFERMPLFEGLPMADVLSLHCPLTDLTQGLVNAQFIVQMKPSALMVNAARGPVVVEQDVADALREGRLAGYATDVLSSEPPPQDHPLLGVPHCVITPHLAWATLESRQRLWDVIVANIRAFSADTPQNVVNR